MKTNIVYNEDCINGIKKIPDNSIDFLLTDIPYNEVNKYVDKHGYNDFREIKKGFADSCDLPLMEFIKECNRVTKGTICIFCGWGQLSDIQSYFRKQDGTLRYIIWEKTNPLPMQGQYNYLSGIEPAVWFKNYGATFNAFCKNTVFRYPSGTSKLHPTQKNLDLFRELIRDNTNPGDLVLDPCIGSGTTAIAAIKEDRKYLGFEINNDAYDICKKRIANEGFRQTDLFDVLDKEQL